MSEPTVIINATVGLSEIIKATAHQRIAAMEQEIERQNDIMYKARSARSNLEEKIATGLVEDCAPPHISTMVSAGLDVMGGYAVWAWWGADDPDSDTYTFRVDALRHGGRRDGTGITKDVEFLVKRWEPTQEIAAMMAEAVQHLATERAAETESRRLTDLLRARDFRDRLEGELMSRFIEGQAPDIARQIAAVATDTNSPRLIGVK